MRSVVSRMRRAAGLGGREAPRGRRSSPLEGPTVAPGSCRRRPRHRVPEYGTARREARTASVLDDAGRPRRTPVGPRTMPGHALTVIPARRRRWPSAGDRRGHGVADAHDQPRAVAQQGSPRRRPASWPRPRRARPRARAAPRGCEPALQAISCQRTPSDQRARRARDRRGCRRRADARSGIGTPPAGSRNPTPRTVSIRRRRRRPQLAAQERDVGVHRVRRDRDPERPRVVEELVARQHLVGVAHQRLEQRELARG